MKLSKLFLLGFVFPNHLNEPDRTFFENDQEIIFQKNSTTKNPQFGTMIPDTTYKLGDLYLDFNSANEYISATLNFSFQLNNKKWGKVYPIFELNYAYGDGNQVIKQEYVVNYELQNASFKFVISQNYFKNGLLNIWCDLHMYWYNFLIGSTTRTSPEIHNYKVNSSQLRNIKNIDLDKNNYKCEMNLPIKLHIDKTGEVFIDNFAKILFTYYFYDYFYYSINNFRITFLDSKELISNFIIHSFEEMVINLPTTSFSTISVVPIISGGDILFTQRIKTYYDPLENLIKLGSSSIYQSIDGICINPFIQNVNGDIVYKFSSTFFMTYDFIVTISIFQEKALFNNKNGLTTLNYIENLNSYFFTYEGTVSMIFTDLND